MDPDPREPMPDWRSIGLHRAVSLLDCATRLAARGDQETAQRLREAAVRLGLEMHRPGGISANG